MYIYHFKKKHTSTFMKYTRHSLAYKTERWIDVSNQFCHLQINNRYNTSVQCFSVLFFQMGMKKIHKQFVRNITENSSKKLNFFSSQINKFQLGLGILWQSDQNEPAKALGLLFTIPKSNSCNSLKNKIIYTRGNSSLTCLIIFPFLEN